MFSSTPRPMSAHNRLRTALQKPCEKRASSTGFTKSLVYESKILEIFKVALKK